MDAPGLPAAEVADAYRVLRRVNWMLGNNRTLDVELKRFVNEGATDQSRPPIFLDVGTGSGDVPARLGARLAGFWPGRRVLAFGLDRDAVAVGLADDGAAMVRGDALRLPLADGAVDLVTAVKFAHHFEGEGLSRLLFEMARVARRRVIVLDIRRSWAAYWGFVAWSRVFTRNRLVRHDGPLSVLRGFTDDELLDVARPLRGFRWEVRRYLGYQLVLVGERADA